MRTITRTLCAAAFLLAMAGFANAQATINLIPTTTIAGNTTIVSGVLEVPEMRALMAQANFVYAAGGGTVDVYVQTSLDKGATWIDLINFHATTANYLKVGGVALSQLAPGNALANAGVSDGGLTANTTYFPPPLGDRIRVKVVVAGTAYSGATTLRVDVSVKR